jgi:hypothetical protein
VATNIDKYVEPSEIPAGAGVPVGGIIPWLSPIAGAPEPTPPTGFEYCDGGLVTTGGSPLLGFTKPAYMNTVANPTAGQRVPRGADTNAAPYGGIANPPVSAGADAHTHSGTSDPGTHSHSMSGHTHSQSSHTHTISSQGNHTHQAGSGGTNLAGGFGGISYVDAGAHSHGGNTGGPSVANTGSPSVVNTVGDGAHTHTVNSGGQAPAHVAIAFIIRVL